jgi:protein subunit release factor B
MKQLVLSVKANDCNWEYFPAGKNGGQKANKTASACRVTHPESGATGESREQRSQLQNRRTAWRRMVESAQFKVWLARKLSQGPTPEERVAKDMQPQNLRVEVKRNGKWVDEKAL